MNERDLFRAIGDVDDELVTGAEKTSVRRPLRVYLSGALAACLCVALLFVALRFLPAGRTADNANEFAPELAETSADYLTSMEGNTKGPEIGLSNDGNGSMLNPAQSDPAGLYSATQQPTVSGLPAELRFSVTWGDNSFDSQTGLLTENGGHSYTLTLTEQELARAWSILSALGNVESDPDGDIVVTYTAEGQTEEVRLFREPPSYGSLLFDDLMDIIEHAASRVR